MGKGSIFSINLFCFFLKERVAINIFNTSHTGQISSSSSKGNFVHTIYVVSGSNTHITHQYLFCWRLTYERVHVVNCFSDASSIRSSIRIDWQFCMKFTLKGNLSGSTIYR